MGHSDHMGTCQLHELEARHQNRDTILSADIRMLPIAWGSPSATPICMSNGLSEDRDGGTMSTIEKGVPIVTEL